LAAAATAPKNGVARKSVLAMKTNITLKIDSGRLQEAKIVAAENGTSISTMMAVQLDEKRLCEGAPPRHCAHAARLRSAFHPSLIA